MKTLLLFLAAIFGFVSLCSARAVRVVALNELFAGSKLVFVGEVQSVKPSGMTLMLSYPTWKGTTFEWLEVETKVIEPLKGVKKGGTIKTMMLSARDKGPMFNPPGMVGPEKGRKFLLCLLPTPLEDHYASFTAPWDDKEAIFILDRSNGEYGGYKKDPKHFDEYPEYRDRYRAIWSLVNDVGKITPEGAKALRRQYKKELDTAPSKEAVIYLQWKTKKSKGGWQWDVPLGKDGKEVKEAQDPVGPVTLPGN